MNSVILMDIFPPKDSMAQFAPYPLSLNCRGALVVQPCRLLRQSSNTKLVFVVVHPSLGLPELIKVLINKF